MPGSLGFRARNSRWPARSRQAIPETPYSRRSDGLVLRKSPARIRARPPKEARIEARAVSARTSKY